MLDNNQTWGYNNGIATLNGPARMGSRSANRRAPLPTVSCYNHGQMFTSNANHSLFQTWTDQNGSLPPMPQLYADPGQHLGFNNSEHDLASMTDSRGVQTPVSNDSEQLIPTAIVIKNIQFQCRKEMLQALMVNMNLPQPYAFNYHFDKGVFRGLAFANFSTPEDTAMVIERMNGLDVMGRKLRVEYKKMLPQDERDRIDREKREKRGQLEEQHRAPLPTHQQTALASLGISGNREPRGSPLRR